MTTSPAIIVEKNVTMRETVYDLHRQKSKRMQKNSEKWSMKDMGLNLPMEDDNKQHWSILRIHHTVLWWASTLRNGMISHLLDSCFPRPHHKISWRWNTSLMNPENFFHNKCNAKIICVVDIILAYAEEYVIDGNWCLLDNKSTCKAFINVKYLSNIINAPGGKYPRVHCNVVVN